ncbi:MAG: ParA family protein [Planctomycetota bacterium]|nr:MAG: ParA family protein [Planctomycetota bacterium]
MRKIAVINQKGGVGKTTTVVNLAAALARMGQRVLALDIDPQANLSVHLNIDVATAERTIYEVLSGTFSLTDVIQTLPDEGFDMVSSNIDLAGAEIELVSQMGRETILRDAVDALCKSSPDYDFLIIDCPPSLGLLTINSLTAVRELFIPLQVQFFALQGVTKLLEIANLVRSRLNPDLEITGIIPQMFDQRTKLSHEVLEEIHTFFKNTVTNTVVRSNIRLAEAPSHGKSIFRHAPSSFGAADYQALAEEVLNMVPQERVYQMPEIPELPPEPAAEQTQKSEEPPAEGPPSEEPKDKQLEVEETFMKHEV